MSTDDGKTTEFLIREYESIRAEIRTVHTVSQVVVGGGLYFAATNLLNVTPSNWWLPGTVAVVAGIIYLFLYGLVSPMAALCREIERVLLGRYAATKLGWENRLPRPSDGWASKLPCSLGTLMLLLYMGLTILIWGAGWMLRCSCAG